MIAQPPAPTVAAQKTILVADDEPKMRLLLSLILQRGPYRVVAAGDGEEAIRVAGEERPDLILLDAEMPRLHGFDACRRLRADPATRGTAIVMLTAKTQGDDRARGFAAGADAYVTKPFHMEDLLSKIRRLLPER